MKIQHQVLVVLILSLLACSKVEDDPNGVPIEDDDNIVTIEDDTLAVLWCEPLTPDTAAYTLTGPFLYQDRIIYGINTPVNSTLRAFSQNEGKEIWTWQSDLDFGQIPGLVNGVVQDDKLWIGAHSEIFAIQLDQGQSDLEYAPAEGCGNPRTNLIGDYFYFQSQSCAFDQDEVFLIRIHTQEKTLDTIYIQPKEDGYIPEIEAPTFWVNPEGDSILIFQNRSLHETTFAGRIDLYGFNVRKRAVEFKISDISPFGNSSVNLPLVYKDRLYFQGVKNLFCIDLNTQEILWERNFNEFGEQLLITRLLLVEDRFLIVNPDNSNLYALNPDNGNLYWKRKERGSNCSQMVYHKGIIYYTSIGEGFLYGVEASSGEIITKQKAPKFLIGAVPEGFTRPIAVDHATNTLFATDFAYHYAFKLQE